MATPAMSTAPEPMRRLAGFLLWSCLFAALLLATDQIFLRLPMPLPVLGEVRIFYLDFRQRLLQLPQCSSRPVPAPKITTHLARKAGAKPAPSPRYVYADDQGNLQFAESLEEVPAHLRRDVRPLKP